jgi:hypothetical protein
MFISLQKSMNIDLIEVVGEGWISHSIGHMVNFQLLQVKEDLK